MSYNKFLIDLGPSSEATLLLENLDEYIKLLGISRKRFYLMGAAAFIGQQADNVKLIEQISDYLTGAGAKLGRKNA